MAEPKLPPEAWNNAMKLLEKMWTEKGDPAAKAILDDMIAEGQKGIKAYGLNSVEVKKDLVKKFDYENRTVGQDLATENADLSNDLKKQGKRNDAMDRGEQVSTSYSDPIFSRMRDSRFTPNRDLMGQTEANRKAAIVHGPSKYTRPNEVWQNLMKDPAVPTIAAGAAGAGAALYSSNANAQTAPSFDAIEEAAPTTAPSFDAIEAAPAQAAAPVAPQAPVATDPYAGTGGTSSAPEPVVPVQPDNTQENISDALSTITPIGGLQQIEKHVVDPALKWTQKNVGAPALDAALSAQKTLGVGNVIPGQEYLSRASGSLLTGPEPMEKWGGTVAGAKNIEELTQKFGEIPAAVAATASKLMGDVPLFLISGPKSGAAVFDHATTGALIGLADPEMSMAEGAVMGTALHGVSKAALKIGSAAVDLMKPGVRQVLGIMDKTFKDFFVDSASKFKLEFGAPKSEPVPAGMIPERQSLFFDPEAADSAARSKKLLEESGTLRGKGLGMIDKKPSSALQTLHDMAHAPEAVTIKIGLARDLGTKIKPLYGTVIKDGDALVARFDQPHVDGMITRVDIPLKTNSDFVKLRGLLERDLDTTSFTVSREADEVMTPEARRALGRGGSADAPSAQEPDTGQSYFLTQNGDALELHEISSTEGKMAALDHRGGMVAIDTPDGPKYGRVMTDESNRGSSTAESSLDLTKGEREDIATRAEYTTHKQKPPQQGHVGVAPYGPEEGIPTFGGVYHEKQLRRLIPDDELRNVLEKRVTPPPPPPPDVPEDMPPPPPPGPPPPPEAAMMERIKAFDKKLPFWTRVGRQLVGAHLRAPADLAGYISDQQSVKNLAAGWVNINSALEKRAGAGATQEFREEVAKVFRKELTWEQFSNNIDKSNNELAKAARNDVRDLVSQTIQKRDANQKWLAERGYVPDDTWEQSAGDAVNSYATQEYLAHFLKPGERLKMVQQNEKLLRDSVAGYQAWAEKAGKKLSDDAALKKIVESLGSEDPGSILFEDKAQASGNSPTAKLRYRKELPEWYQNMLGKIGGFLQISRTLATQDALIANFTVFEGVAKDPRWAQDAEIKGVTDGWTRFPPNKNLYGAMAGKLAPPDVYDALHTIPNIKNEIHKWIAIPLGIVKTNQVSLGSFRTFLNMTMDNLAGGVLSGGLDLTRPFEAGSAIRYAARAMREVSSIPLIGKANPLGDNEFAQFIRDARRIGVDAPGHIGSDLTSEQKRLVKNAYAEIEGVKGDGSSMLSKFYELHQKAGAKGSMVVDGIDRVQKLASWKILTDKFEEAGMGLEEAQRAAARRIFSSYPMYDRVGLLTDKMRSNLMGIVSPYSTFAMERNRILGMLPGRLLDSVANGASEDPGLKFRLLKYSLLGAAMFGANGAFRRTFGNVSDAEVDLAMQRRSGSGTDKFSPNDAVWAAPFHDGRGKLALVDMTQWLGVLSYLQGDPRLAPVANMAINVVKQPLSGGLLGSAVDTGLKQFGINSGMDARPIPPGSGFVRGVAIAADMAANNGAAPRGLMDLYNNIKKTGAIGDIGKNRDTLTPTQAALRTFPGIPFEQNVTNKGKQQQFKTDKKNARAILFHANKLPLDAAHDAFQKVYETMLKYTGWDDSEKKSMQKEAHDKLKAISKEQQKYHDTQRKAKLTGGK